MIRRNGVRGKMNLGLRSKALRLLGSIGGWVGSRDRDILDVAISPYGLIGMVLNHRWDLGFW